MPSREQLRVLMRARTLVASAVLLVGVAGCGDASPSDGAPGADPVVPAAGTVDLDGTETEVVLPSGQLTFTVTEPRESVPAEDAEDDADHDAPEGSAYIGLGWQHTGPAPAFGPVLHGTTPQSAEVRLRAGEEGRDVFTVDTQSTSGESAWVLVPVGDQSAVLEIEYDGLVQELDLATGEVDAGVAQGLYDVRTATVDCPDQRGEPGAALSYTIACRTSPATVTPYVADLGWSAEGASWLVFDLTLQPSTFLWKDGGTRTSFSVEEHRGSVAGDGAVVLLEERLASAGYSGTLAVPATGSGPTKVGITHNYSLARRGSGGTAPATEDVTFDATVTVASSNG
ncbi:MULTISPECIES: hypothetical protein [Nocardioides]|uniref:Secreted protein n=1 Tax=Nocardioides vastitatis TaxID=2568655 RepID=A0ABW0ZLQ1_9ACTN|nr:hypothetical protein [Nocardioides sp.]THJ03052.1 hypothetical protein E7Z54_09820 [Nocardioides sp.]